RDEAQFRGAMLAAARQDSPGGTDLQSTRTATQVALALVGVAPDGEARPTLDDHLTAAEKEKIGEGCYELLLVLSLATEQNAEALRLLDRAAQLGPPTRALPLLRADRLARQGDRGAAAAERAQARARPPASASDHYFTGVARYQAGD